MAMPAGKQGCGTPPNEFELSVTVTMCHLNVDIHVALLAFGTPRSSRERGHSTHFSDHPKIILQSSQKLARTRARARARVCVFIASGIDIGRK